jgi:hypothetical protein
MATAQERVGQAAMESCENCGRGIGKFETPWLHGERTVCQQCWERLNAESAAAPPLAAPQIPASRPIVPGNLRRLITGFVAIGCSFVLFVLAIYFGAWSELFYQGADILSTSQRLLGLSMYVSMYVFQLCSTIGVVLGAFLVTTSFVQPRLESVVVLAIAVSAFALYAVANPRWEYATISPDDAKFERVIDQMGNRRWELVVARRAARAGSRDEMAYEMIFKRRRFP